MSVAKPRNRLVFFRVSEDEFQKLASLCASGTRARSISELARFAVHKLIGDGTGETTLAQLDKRIDDLQQQVRVLTTLLARDTPGFESQMQADLVQVAPDGAEGM